MALGDYQKLSRLLAGKPFGTGKDGSYSDTSIPTIVYKTCSGSSGTKTLSADTDASPFAVGDILLIHQSRGTGVGQWEFNKVSTVGSDQYSLQESLTYTYTDSGSSQAQAILVPQYTDITMPSGTWTTTAWNGDTGGIFSFLARGTLTITGTISGNGGSSSAANYTNTSSGATGGGFRGADSIFASDGRQGEGTSGAGGTQSTSANGNGGGGSTNDKAGSGGGNGTAGASAGDSTGGSAVGNAGLTNLCLGGAGGAGRDSTNDASNRRSGGGAGGAGIIIFAKNIVITGSLTANGGSSANCAHPGGAGAGGSVLLACQTATLGTLKITATGGTGGSGDTVGGNGGTGTVALYYSGSYTGTTNPTVTATQDLTLVEGGLAFIL